MSVVDPAMERGSRIRGCILGGAIGDALGNPIEFLHLDRIRQRYGSRGLTELETVDGAALITDDTQMTLFTVEGLIRAIRRGDGRTEPVVRRAYQRWLDTQLDSPRPGDHATGRLRDHAWLYHRRAPGNACLSGLRLPGDGVERFTAWGTPGPVNPDSKGCGSVMRAAPFGLAADDPREAFELAARCALYTHGHPTGYLAAGAFAAIVHQLATGLRLPDAVTVVLPLLRDYPGHGETLAALEHAVILAADGEPTPERVETLGGGWIAEEALAVAVYCALVAPTDPRWALLLSVNHSGDSDSTGAICGNLLGAEHGHPALPADWLTLVEHHATITAIADDLAFALRGGRELATARPDWAAKYPGD